MGLRPHKQKHNFLKHIHCKEATNVTSFELVSLPPPCVKGNLRKRERATVMNKV